jgi:hypothetical protein
MSAKKKSTFPIEGGCTCRAVRYRMMSKPMFVHCCHCTWCQRETGSAFVINALIETDRVKLLQGKPVMVLTPSNSGKGQNIARCASCHVALWSHYQGAGPKAAFVRVGTLDNPNVCPPDIHIFTSTKQVWVTLPKGARVMKEYYKLAKEWPAEAIERREIMRAS